MRRRILLRSALRPYFQEWKRLEHFKGKSFVGGERLFRREKALWFPNLWGWTLAEGGGYGYDARVEREGEFGWGAEWGVGGGAGSDVSGGRRIPS